MARHRLIAIPPDAKKPGMSSITLTEEAARGVPVRGDGNDNYVCGHCSRLLLHNVDSDNTSIFNVWITCPKCNWLNGMDLDLAWAQYVIEQLQMHLAKSTQLRDLLEELQSAEAPPEEVLERYPDLPLAVSWLARISPATLIAILTLLIGIYYGEQGLRVAAQSRDIAAREEARELRESRDDAVRGPDRPQASLSSADIDRIARALHELQRKIEVRPPGPQRARTPGKRRGRR